MILDPQTDLLAGLNPVQARAVTHPGGPLLIVAGAGSGKTRVLTHRIAWLIAEQGVSPFEILAITFTNKAAQEMRERVEALVGPVARRMWVSTFHAACVRILRRDAGRLGLQGQLHHLRPGRRRPPDRLRHPGSQPRRQEVPAPGRARPHLDRQERAGRLRDLRPPGPAPSWSGGWPRSTASTSSGCWPPTPWTSTTCCWSPSTCCRPVPTCSSTTSSGSATSWSTSTRTPTGPKTSWSSCSPAPTIRSPSSATATSRSTGWRGADIRNILQFEEAFPDATVVVLEQNYRSTQTILDAANAVIANNAMRKPKALWTEQGSGAAGRALPRRGRARRRALAGGRDRQPPPGHAAEAVGRYEWGDIAVFYRTNAQSRAVEEELVRRDIPYKVVGGTRFYDRAEIKDLLAYLRAVANPTDEVSLKRIVNVPKRGVGDTSVARLDRFAQQHDVPFADAMAGAEAAGVTRQGAGRHRRSATAARRPARPSARRAAARPSCSTPSLDRTGYLEALEAEHTIEAAGRIENIEELVGAAREAEDLDAFLEEVSLVADADEVDGDTSKVTLMTLHTAKGLEYPVVFIVGMEDGVFPHLRSLGEPDEMEEERRLAYVGHHPGPGAAVPVARLVPQPVGPDPVQPAEPVPQRDPRRPGATPRRAGAARPPASPAGAVGTRSSSRPCGGKRSARCTGPAPSCSGLRAGETVVHAKWGEGVVIEVHGEGDRAEAKVRFPSVGEKHLALSLAPFKRA